jgi:hypothetical protein
MAMSYRTLKTHVSDRPLRDIYQKTASAICGKRVQARLIVRAGVRAGVRSMDTHPTCCGCKAILEARAQMQAAEERKS